MEPEFYETMCLRGDRLKELCDLYPKTANTLKYQSLKKRNQLMKHLDKQLGQIRDRMKDSNQIVGSNIF